MSEGVLVFHFDPQLSRHIVVASFDLCGKNACGAEVSLLKNKSQSLSQVHTCFPINSC